MVSGWDKSPGPDNDYASVGPTGIQTLRFIALALALVGGAALLIMR
jgi:hypothetical protein